MLPDAVALPKTDNIADGLSPPIPTKPEPLGIRARCSLDTVVISVDAPENTSPVEPMVLFVNTSVPASVASVPVVGSVIVVEAVVVSVRGNAPLVVNASANEIVFALGMVSGVGNGQPRNLFSIKCIRHCSKTNARAKRLSIKCHIKP
jgi:hypothetical protein